jgi:hypothetical protein
MTHSKASKHIPELLLVLVVAVFTIHATAQKNATPPQLPPDTLKKTAYRPLTESELIKLMKFFPGRSPRRSLPPVGVTPAVPFVYDRAYLRASTVGESIVFSALGYLQIPLNVPGASLAIFVHGQPNEITVIQCYVDGENGLAATFSAGPDAAHLTPDPQHRTITATSGGGSFLFAVPADVSSLSPSNWFSLNLLPPSPGGSPVYAAFYGCNAFFVD